MTDPLRRGLCQNHRVSREILFAIHRSQFAHRPEGRRYPADGYLLLLAPADFDGGSGNGIYRSQRDRLV